MKKGHNCKDLLFGQLAEKTTLKSRDNEQEEKKPFFEALMLFTTKHTRANMDPVHNWSHGIPQSTFINTEASNHVPSPFLLPKISFLKLAFSFSLHMPVLQTTSSKTIHQSYNSIFLLLEFFTKLYFIKFLIEISYQSVQTVTAI